MLESACALRAGNLYKSLFSVRAIKLEIRSNR